MITVQKPKPKNNQVAVIRSASCSELTNYEKNKLASIEERAQQNKIEAIRVNAVDKPIADKRVVIDQETKTAHIDLGNLAFKNAVTPEELDSDSFFFIKCELDELAFTQQDDLYN